MANARHRNLSTILLFTVLMLLRTGFISSSPPSSFCTGKTPNTQHNETRSQSSHALKYKLIAICSILIASGTGVSLPFLVKSVPSLHPDRDIYFLIKAFAAGIILATGFIHVLPDAFDSLTSSCLALNPWGTFPVTGFVAMMSAIGTLILESLATGYHRRSELRKALPVDGDDEETVAVGADFILERSNSSDLIRHRVISQVLELGIVVHSVIIGISLGASQSAKTIKPLVAALSFHQFFEGMGLGGCIAQAKFKTRVVTIMVIFFSLTTPVGISIGIGISKVYAENSPTALIVQGLLNSASAGILVYMALVDLLAADFMKPQMQTNFRLQLGANAALLLGACCMSLLAKWGGM